VLAAKPLSIIQDSDTLFAPLKGERHVALAVSGGSDSMALLRLAVDWAKGFVKFTVLTVDHGLRPEAAAEATHVAAWCAALALDHHILKWTADKPKTGVQAKARKARYDLLADWCVRNGVGYLLTGHTLDDQAETVVMRQARTDTVESLAGIWQTRDWGGIKIMRPLLTLRRQDLQGVLGQLGQSWIEDPSNDDQQYERVRVRRAMLQTSVADLAQIATDAGQVARELEKAARTWLGQHLVIFPEGYGVVPRGGFSALGAEIQRRVLQQLVACFGAGHRVEPGELDHISGWIVGGGLSRRTLGGAVFASRKKTLVIGRESGRISSEVVLLPDSGEILWDGRYLVRAPAGSKVVAAEQLKAFARRNDIPSFVQAGLPSIVLENGTIACPHLGLAHGVTAKFMRCLR
jgi:tRNA(Ile)-lysidine synthase